MAIEKPAAKKSAYQTIKPENQASGHCRRIRTAHNSAVGLSRKKAAPRATRPDTIPCIMRTVF